MKEKGRAAVRPAFKGAAAAYNRAAWTEKCMPIAATCCGAEELRMWMQC